MYKPSIGGKESSKWHLSIILSYALADILSRVFLVRNQYEDKVSCSKTQHLVLAGIELPLSGLIQQTTKKKKKKKNRYFFYYQENRIWHSCNGDNLQILFSWKNEKNISKCRLLKILARVLGVMVCTNKSRMGLCMAKPTSCTKRRISLHTLSLHISSLIRAFANRMYLLQYLGLTKCLVRRAKTRVNLRNCTFW